MVSHSDMNTNRNTSRWLRRASWAPLCVLLVAATACGGGSSGSQQSAAPSQSSSTTQTSSAQQGQPAALQITINGFQYASPATVPPDAKVTVVNNDSAEHTVTSDTAGVFDTEVGGKSKASFSAPGQPGSYPFHCTYHPNMHGVLVVL